MEAFCAALMPYAMTIPGSSQLLLPTSSVSILLKARSITSKCGRLVRKSRVLVQSRTGSEEGCHRLHCQAVSKKPLLGTRRIVEI